MRKDGLLEKVMDDLRRVYDETVKQPLPPDFKALLDKLK